MIPDEKKEEVREAADIVEVISDYVKLKRSGSGYVGLCPFHDEKTPSFHVTPRLNIYKCFGCGESGDIFNFVMQMEGVGFTESLRSLADRYHISLPEKDEEEYDEDHHLREGIYHALRYAGVYYHQQLAETDEAEKARTYLKDRGYTPAIIKKYGLGYAPSAGESFLKAALDTGLNEEYLHEAGLIKPSSYGEGYYDAFRGRLMFPIFNPSGKVIAFAGRVMGDEKTAKYINSPQTKVYNKSQTVYALNFARHDIRKHDEAILVEGYTDVLTLHQAGIIRAVATSGTSLTPQQMEAVHRYGDTVTIVYDSDAAGVNAMLRSIDIALSEGLDVKLLELPEGEDPDSFVKQFGKESFLELKNEEAQDFIGFIIQKAKAEGKWSDPSNRKKITTRILKSIACIGDPVGREMFVQHLNTFTKVGDRSLMEELGKILGEKKQQQKRSWRRKRKQAEREQRAKEEQQSGRDSQTSKRNNNSSSTAPKKRNNCEKDLIRLMLLFKGEMVEYIGSLCNEKQFQDDQLRQFYSDLIERYENDEPISIEHYSNREHPFPELVGEIVLDRHAVSERASEKQGVQFKKDKHPYRSAKGALKALNMHYLEKLQNEFNEQYHNAEGEEKKELNRKIRDIGRRRSKLQRNSLDELYPDPDPQNTSSKTEERGTFYYEMKTGNNN